MVSTPPVIRITLTGDRHHREHPKTATILRGPVLTTGTGQEPKFWITNRVILFGNAGLVGS